MNLFMILRAHPGSSYDAPEDVARILTILRGEFGFVAQRRGRSGFAQQRARERAAAAERRSNNRCSANDLANLASQAWVFFLEQQGPSQIRSCFEVL